MTISQSTVTDSTLLPFGTADGVKLFEGDNWVDPYDYGQWFGLEDIFEDGLQIGDETYTGFRVSLGYGIQFGNGQGYDATRIAAVHANIADYVYYGGTDASGVYIDNNTDRDSVVITWSGVQSDWYDRTTFDFQIEIIDRGDNDAEVIFRFDDMSGYSYTYSIYGHSYFVIDGEGSARTPLGYVSGITPAMYDDITGNTGVEGVWQFTLEDGQLNPDEFTISAVVEDGTTGDDSYTGYIAGDVLRGAEGNDTLDGGFGDDTLNGGVGDDSLTGGAGWNILFGGDGNDTLNNAGSNGGELYAGSGDNLIHGGSMTETIISGDGNDTITVSGGHNTIQAGGGENRIISSDWSNDRITTGDDADAIEAGGGNDTINTFGGDDTVQAESGDDTVHSGDGDDFVLGQDGDDYITGGLGSDTLNGGDDDDYVFGAQGDDTLLAGKGRDTLIGGEGNDSLDGGTARTYSWTTRYDSKQLHAGAGDDTVMGGNFNDTISGGDGNDYIDGRRGNDSMGAGDGDDTIIGSDWDGTDEDWIYAGAGNDSVFGGGGHDTIYGGEGNDTLVGGFGLDLILGGDGDDIIFGGEGYDELFGGEGADKFVASGAKTDVSVVNDYDADEGDVLVLDTANVEKGNLRLLGDRLTDLDGNPAEFRTLTLIDVGDDSSLEQTIFTFANATELDRLVIHMTEDGAVTEVIDLGLF
jgi:Ca2+-binding RTX toxin-like protein